MAKAEAYKVELPPAIRPVWEFASAVKGFENWLIFYTPLPDGIHFRLLVHGARDLPRQLESLGTGEE